jgi:hypothetical protein
MDIGGQSPGFQGPRKNFTNRDKSFSRTEISFMDSPARKLEKTSKQAMMNQSPMSFASMDPRTESDGMIHICYLCILLALAEILNIEKQISESGDYYSAMTQVKVCLPCFF